MQISCNLILKSPMQKNSIDNLERKKERKRDKKERMYRKRKKEIRSKRESSQFN